MRTTDEKRHSETVDRCDCHTMPVLLCPDLLPSAHAGAIEDLALRLRELQNRVEELEAEQGR